MFWNFEAGSKFGLLDINIINPNKNKSQIPKKLNPKKNIERSSFLEFGIWSLGFGVWDLEFGIWSLGFGVWDLGFKLISPTARTYTQIGNFSSTKIIVLIIEN
ncbi:MAG: hypothetical protein ABIG89_07315 [Candidatus Woesearchaeota archaeon]